MNPLTIAMSVSAGISLYAGSVHLLIGLTRRPPDRTHIAFAIGAISLAVHCIALLAVYKAGSTEEYMQALRIALGAPVLLMWISLVWFVSFYTSVKPRLILMSLTAWFTIVVMLHLVLPQGLLFTEIGELRTTVLPWGEQIVVASAAPHSWHWLVDLYFVAVLGFFFYALIQQYRWGHRNSSTRLGVAFLLILAATAHDSLIDLGVIQSIALNPFAFLSLAIVMSLGLSNDMVVSEHRQNEYRKELELKVAERTSELLTTNAQLSNQVMEREAAEAELGRRVVALNALHQIAKELANVQDLPAALRCVGETVTALFGVRATYFALPGETPETVRIADWYEESVEHREREPVVFPLSDLPVTAQVLRGGRPVVVADALSMPLSIDVQAFAASRGIRSMLSVPLIIRGQVIGAMTVATDQPNRAFTESEVSLAETISGDVAAALEHARLFTQAQSDAAAAERGRLARELHDAVTQTIYSASLIGQSLPRVWERDPVTGQRYLSKMNQLVGGALAEMRMLLFELRPAALQGASLSGLVRHLTDVLIARTGASVSLDVKGEPEPPTHVKIALYRIVQEALNNIAKHANASSVQVRIASTPGCTRITIGDNGSGFDADRLASDGMGVRIMRERAEEVGATFTVKSTPGEGTVIAAVWREHAANGQDTAASNSAGLVTETKAHL